MLVVVAGMVAEDRDLGAMAEARVHGHTERDMQLRILEVEEVETSTRMVVLELLSFVIRGYKSEGKLARPSLL
jgi:hypothetical protein